MLLADFESVGLHFLNFICQFVKLLAQVSLQVLRDGMYFVPNAVLEPTQTYFHFLAHLSQAQL